MLAGLETLLCQLDGAQAPPGKLMGGCATQNFGNQITYLIHCENFTCALLKCILHPIKFLREYELTSLIYIYTRALQLLHE